MRLSIKAKQVAGVTSIVGLAIVAVSAFYLSSLVRIRLEESRARGELLANAIFQRAREVVSGGGDPGDALRADAGLRSILESSAYSKNVVYAAIVNVDGVAVAHSDDTQVGRRLPSAGELGALLGEGSLTQVRAIYAGGGRTLDVSQPLLLGTTEFGSIRIGVSMLLVRQDVSQALAPALITLLAALIASTLAATLLAQLLLRPIHVIRSGLSRLGQGEFGVKVNLPQHDEFGELGDFFNTISARLSSAQAPTHPDAETPDAILDRMEDAVAVFSPQGDILFANHAFRSTSEVDSPDAIAGDAEPSSRYRAAVEDALLRHAGRKPLSPADDGGADGDAHGVVRPIGHRGPIETHIIEDARRKPLAVVAIAPNVDDRDRLRSLLRDARKLSAFSRLSAGVAHEVKNPLNATVIHLELLKQQVAGADLPLAAEHVSIIAAQMRRLDEVVQGFLKFIRPEDVVLRPVSIAEIVDDIKPIVVAEAEKYGVDVRIEVPGDLPLVNSDAGMLQQALLNLALNACQAMASGGRLRIAAATTRGRRVEIVCEDTGVGIAPEHLDRIFDLYYTTKEQGTGIGLSMVYRTVQLLDGDIEVESTPGHGTTFRVRLPQA